MTFLQCNYPSDLPGNNWSVLVHLPKPFLLSPGIFWSYSQAPTIPGSLPTPLCEVSFQCSQNTCSEMAAFLGKLRSALKGCGFGQVAVLGPGRELLGLA